MMDTLKALRHFLAAPVFLEDEERTRSAGLINIIVLGSLPILLVFSFLRIINGAEPFGAANLILTVIIVILCLVWILMRAGFVIPAVYLHVTTIWLASTMIALNGGGIRGTALTGYFVVMLMAGLLLGWRPALGFTLLSILAVFGLASAERAGIIHYVPGTAASAALEGTVLLVFGALFLYLIISSLQNALHKANANEPQSWPKGTTIWIKHTSGSIGAPHNSRRSLK
jgi:hypothetical protein